MDPAAVVKHFGSQVALAAALGITKASVSKFVKAGAFPRRREYEIERITNGKFKAKFQIPVRRSAVA